MVMAGYGFPGWILFGALSFPNISSCKEWIGWISVIGSERIFFLTNVLCLYCSVHDCLFCCDLYCYEEDFLEPLRTGNFGGESLNYCDDRDELHTEVKKEDLQWGEAWIWMVRVQVTTAGRESDQATFKRPRRCRHDDVHEFWMWQRRSRRCEEKAFGVFLVSNFIFLVMKKKESD